MAIFLRESDVAEFLSMDEAIAAVEQSFRIVSKESGSNRPRQRVRVPNGQLHVLPGGSADLGAIGLKAYTGFRGQPTRFMVILYDADNGAPLCVVEADRLGQIRTGAASGVASKYLAAEGADEI